MQTPAFDLINLFIKFFWKKINNWLKEKKILKEKVKELKKLNEDKEAKIIKLENENKLITQNFNNLKEENTKLKLENQGKFKNYLQEKKFFIESYYRSFTLKLDGYICSFTKEKETIFSLLNLFSEEYLQAFHSKEKIFQDDFVLFEEFFSLRPFKQHTSATITDKNLAIRDCLVRAKLYATVKGSYRRIGKIGIDKLNFLKFLIDDYIQKQATEILDDYFVCHPYSSFVEKSTTRLSSLLKIRF